MPFQGALSEIRSVVRDRSVVRCGVRPVPAPLLDGGAEPRPAGGTPRRVDGCRRSRLEHPAGFYDAALPGFHQPEQPRRLPVYQLRPVVHRTLRHSGQFLRRAGVGYHQPQEPPVAQGLRLSRVAERRLGVSPAAVRLRGGAERAHRLRHAGRARHGESRSVARDPDLRRYRYRESPAHHRRADLSGLAYAHPGDVSDRHRERLRLRVRVGAGAVYQRARGMLRRASRFESELRAVPDRGDPGAVGASRTGADRQLAAHLPGPGGAGPSRGNARRHCRRRESRGRGARQGWVHREGQRCGAHPGAGIRPWPARQHRQGAGRDRGADGGGQRRAAGGRPGHRRSDRQPAHARERAASGADPGPRHHGPGVVSGRHLGVRLDRSGAPTGNRLFRPRPDGLDQAGRRRVVVRVLVQRLHRELRDFAGTRHLRAPAQRVHFPERARRGETDSFRLPERPGSTAAGVARELRGGQGLRRPAGARQRAVARAVRRDHGHAPPGRAAAGGRQARGAAAAGNGPPARRASSRGPSQGADARRDGDSLGRHRPLKALVLVVLLSAPGSLTGQPACGQGRTWMFGPFDKPKDANPVITPSPASRFRSAMSDTIARWEEHATFNPAAVVKDGRVFVLYRAEDASGERMIGGHTSRIGLAESQDGLHFTRRSAPVLYPDTDAQRPYEWPGGVEDPRIVEAEDGSYVLTYTQWNRRIPRLAVATSRDLVHWTKHGPAFAQAYGGKYLGLESKSGAILARVEGSRVIATKVGGMYWMYFNVPDGL